MPKRLKDIILNKAPAAAKNAVHYLPAMAVAAGMSDAINPEKSSAVIAAAAVAGAKSIKKDY